MEPDSWIKIASLAVTLMGIGVKQWWTARPKLVSYFTHASAFTGYGLAAAPIGATSHVPSSVPDSTVGGTAANAPGSTSYAYSPNPPLAPIVHSHSIVIRNVGRESAKNIRIGHAVRPMSYELQPRAYHVAADANNGWEIWLPALVPGEQIQIAYLYPSTVTWPQINCYVKSDEMKAIILPYETLPVAAVPTWRRVSESVLKWFGVFAVVYAAISLIAWLHAR